MFDNIYRDRREEVVVLSIVSGNTFCVSHSGAQVSVYFVGQSRD